MFFQTIMRDPSPHQHKQAGWAHVYAIFPLKAETPPSVTLSGTKVQFLHLKMTT